jgi:hypothetical protein
MQARASVRILLRHRAKGFLAMNARPLSSALSPDGRHALAMLTGAIEGNARADRYEALGSE